MKKISLALALAAMLVFGGTALAGVVKATGGVEYFQAGYFLNFNVHENKAGTKVWGNLKNRTEDGRWYRAKVNYVNDLGTTDTVLFAADIIASNVTGWVGQAILIQVKDVDSPGAKGPDRVWGEFFSSSALAATACGLGTTPSGGGAIGWPVLSGNLVVHVQDG